MVIDYRKKRSRGAGLVGYRKFRQPKVFLAPKIRDKKSILLPKIQFKPLLLIVFLSYIFYLIFFSNKFSIKDVFVEGNNIIKSERVIESVPKNKNIFLVDLGNLRKKIITDNPEIKNVEIYRGIPDALKIVVLEHDNKLVWQTGSEIYLVSIQGEITKKINYDENFNYSKIVDTKNIPVIIGQKIVSPSFIAFITNVNDRFFETTNLKPVGFEITDTTFDVNLRTETGLLVKFNSMRSSAKQLENLKKVLVAKGPEIKEYIDLRIDGWAYYK